MSRAGRTLQARWAALSRHVRVLGPEGRRPTVLMFHGCGGLGAHFDHYAGAATAQGVRVVVVDSFAPRGWSDRFAKTLVCTGRSSAALSAPATCWPPPTARSRSSRPIPRA